MANYHYKQIKDLTHINEQASAFILVFRFKAEEDFSNIRFAAVNSDKDPFPVAVPNFAMVAPLHSQRFTLSPR